MRKMAQDYSYFHYMLYTNEISHNFLINVPIEKSKLCRVDTSKRKLSERNIVHVTSSVFSTMLSE